ncbi:hypothetical protein AURDEDRAFT_43289, partial [Auricularia subglabra TFB-10046 SS5]
GFHITLHWVPGHDNIAGNELADVHANRAADGDTTATRIRLLNTALPRSAATTKAAQKRKDLPRRSASLLTQLRTGHVGLHGFLARIKAVPSALCEVCRVPETVPHFLLQCPRFRLQRHA